MKIFDSKLGENVGKYLFQCSMATVAILAILFVLDVFSQTALIASLGASTFIVFTMPKSYSVQPRALIGGYVVGIAAGCFCSVLCTSSAVASFVDFQEKSLIVYGAFAVGIAIFFMVVTDAEHPPATGVALALVLNQWTYRTIIFILFAVLLLATIKKLLKSVLIDLK